MNFSETEVARVAVAVALVLLILLLQPSFVGGTKVRLCNGHGYLNETDARCSCISRYYGDQCQYSKITEAEQTTICISLM